MELRRISPQAAWELVRRNKCRQRRDYSQIAGYARRMETKVWEEPTPQFTVGIYNTQDNPITLNADGELLDGQHRLYAVILSGMAIKFVIRICEETP